MSARAQLPLPGELAPAARRARPHRRRSYARVWSDPAVVQAEGDAGRLFEEWRDSFVGLVRRLPARRRAELRARLTGRRSSSDRVHLAA